MLLFLMRHGIASPLEGKIRTDAARPLTRAGERRTCAVASGLDALGVAPETIASSPLLRARQTADIAIEQLRHATCRRIAIWPELESAEPGPLLARLHASEARTALLVGHEPGLGRFVSHLLTGSTQGFTLEFKKAAVCALEVSFEAGAAHTVPTARAVLLWHAPPRLLRGS